MTISELYERIINLEALDRSLTADIRKFSSQNDKEGVELATEARRAAQSDILALQQIYDQAKGKSIRKEVNNDIVAS